MRARGARLRPGAVSVLRAGTRESKRVAHPGCCLVRINKASTPTRAQWVYEQLKEAILSGALEPGERLIVDQLARDFGTSPIPVREAIRRLEAEELVETTPYIGARVAPVRTDQLEELMAIRLQLEPLLARTAVLGATPEAIEELDDLVRRMDEAATRDSLAYARLNYEFHRKLYSLSPWSVTLRIVNTVWELSARTRFVLVQVPSSIELSQAEHRAMVDALRRRDGKELERLVRTQKERAFDLFRRTWAAGRGKGAAGAPASGDAAALPASRDGDTGTETSSGSVANAAADGAAGASS